MQQHIYYTKYALHFADMPISELVSIFNAQVHHRGWSSMRACHDKALMDEFKRRGIDTTAIENGRAIFFTNLIRYNIVDNRLISIG